MSKLKIMTVRWTGVRPLLMHSAAMIDPDNKFVRRIEELKGEIKKRKKDDFSGKEELRREVERAEWEGSLYWDGERLFIPGDNIQAAITEAARRTKAGKRAQEALVPINDTPITTKPSFDSLDDLFANPQFQLRQAVRIPPRTGSRIMKVRPMIPTGWELRFDIEYDGDSLPTKDLTTALENAGKYIGIGDWRPKFGRFTVEILKGGNGE